MGNRGHLVIDLGWKSPEEGHKMMIEQKKWYRKLEKRANVCLGKAVEALDDRYENTEYAIEVCMRMLEEWRQELRSDEEKKKPKRKTFSQKNRRRIMERDKYRCKLCGGYKDLEIDHIIPVSRGGSNKASNLQTLCKLCNIRKSDSME